MHNLFLVIKFLWSIRSWSDATFVARLAWKWVAEKTARIRNPVSRKELVNNFRKEILIIIAKAFVLAMLVFAFIMIVDTLFG